MICRGVVSIAISLNKFDLKQCGKSPIPDESEPIEEESHYTTNHYINATNPSSRDPFYGTDKCDRTTTDVVFC